jgi:hypothetical protein
MFGVSAAWYCINFRKFDSNLFGKIIGKWFEEAGRGTRSLRVQQQRGVVLHRNRTLIVKIASETRSSNQFHQPASQTFSHSIHLPPRSQPLPCLLTSTRTTMGNAESSEGVVPPNADGASGEHAEVEIDGSKLGYRVLDVEENGPAACCGLVLYLDFITHVNGVRLDTEDSTLVNLVTQNEGKTLHLTVYNCKRKALREVSFVPCRNWGGAGLLGLMVRFDTYDAFDQSVIRVLDVYAGSPAEEAGAFRLTD